MIKWLVALALLMHGIGHIVFYFASFTPIDMGFTQAPWIFPGDVTLTSPLGKACALLWLVAMIGFVASAIGLVTAQPWWATLAVVSSVISIVVIIPWWNTINDSTRVWALLADVVIIVAFGFPWRERVIEALMG
jgi:hypothetical protein